MTAQKDIRMVYNTLNEKTVKTDLKDTDIPGAIYWRGIPIINFSKNQLITIIYLLMEND